MFSRRDITAFIAGSIVASVVFIPLASNSSGSAAGNNTAMFACVKQDGTIDVGSSGRQIIRNYDPGCPRGDTTVTWGVSIVTPTIPTTTPTTLGTTTTSVVHPTTSTTHPTTTTKPVTTTTVTPTTLPTTTTTAPSGGNPSGQALPGAVAGYNEVCADDFTVPAATGSWGTSSASKVVYTGDHGCKWTEYPDGWSSTNTNGKPGYQPAQVLSVHDGMLDFNLHPISGQASGANPSPILGQSQYTTYGMFSMRMRTDKVAGYHSAVLLWPQNDNDWQSAESDFPEFDLTDNSVSAYAHYGGSGSQDAFENNTLDVTQWHTYTQVWSPGERQYFIDGKLIGTSTHSVYSGVERWQLQIEPSGVLAGGSGHLDVDWVAAYVPVN